MISMNKSVTHSGERVMLCRQLLFLKLIKENVNYFLSVYFCVICYIAKDFVLTR